MVLERFGSALSREARVVARNPPLLGVVTGVWMMLIALMAGLEAHLAVVWFLAVAPSTALVAYGGRRALRRFRGESDGEDEWARRTDREAYDPVDDESAIERLRERYAAGDLSDEEFERRLDKLVETESYVAGSQSRSQSRSPSGDGRERAFERN
ncbi:SHOCT domain-containing protein [Haloferax sp. AB510]|uniref:SHOCT domain-containing protein n=1 Tax=Haloferax sp. AB510 TaxID=2934172 RepID=UPI00209BF05F|nr:SHOCT domain-containing protein [Haloferax sp. AB510]MCO8267482.1 SHOCT domain-containing protein [Haloferax sp. AB510]